MISRSDTVFPGAAGLTQDQKRSRAVPLGRDGAAASSSSRTTAPTASSRSARGTARSVLLAWLSRDTATSRGSRLVHREVTLLSKVTPSWGVWVLFMRLRASALG